MRSNGVTYRITEFGILTQVGENISMGLPMCPSQEGGAQRPQLLGPIPKPKRFDLERQNLVW